MYLYTKINNTIEIWTKVLHTVIVKFTVPFSAIPFIVTSYYLYFTTDLGKDAFHAPVNIKYVLNLNISQPYELFCFLFSHLRLPFNSKTPIGYFVSMFVLMALFEALFYGVSCALSSLISFFWAMMAAGENIQRKVYYLNEYYKANKRDREVQKQLYDLIRFHSEIKELSSNCTHNFF